jgi:predicted Fe-S protein YdhL (DUF1289 family)
LTSSSTTTTTPAAEPQRPALPPSPCVGICALKGDFCYGCGRTSDEIAAWGSLTPSEQSTVWAELPGRLAAFGFKTFRLAASPIVVGDFIGRTFRETTGRWRLVSASLEGSFSVTADVRPEISETERQVQAIAATGETLTLIKHDRVRVFGFASGANDAQMDTIALVLPKGRAQRDLKDQDDLANAGSGTRLPVAEPFALARLLGTDIDLATSSTWPEVSAKAEQLLANGQGRLCIHNALGSITTSKAHFAADGVPADANAPSDVKISRAFVAGAIFHADDPTWLAAALAP